MTNMRRYPSPYGTSLALLTDFYQLTMAYGYWKNKMADKEAVFHLFFRRAPFKGGFTVASGLEAAIDYLENARFDRSDLDYLAGLKGSDDRPVFPEAFLSYLGDLRYTVDVDAVPEGTVVFPHEPLLRVTGPLIQAQLLETPLLNMMNFPSLIATKAARVCLAAQGDSVFEFGARRAQGVDGGLTASRAAYVGGCDATSNVLAGKLFGIPVRGTHSHSWVMVFDEELESFQAYAEAMPNNCVFLVDTYDSLQGVRRAIEVGRRLKERGHQLVGVRLDSGDLTYLSIKARALLDEAGFQDARIFASNELDETLISDLKRQGAQITVWGVGTNLVTGGDYSALDGVYKLSAIRDPGQAWKYRLKLSEQMAKISNPGILQVRRFFAGVEPVADMIYDIGLGVPTNAHIVDPLDPTRQKPLSSSLTHSDLLVPIMRQGRCVYDCPSLPTIRDQTKANLSRFHSSIKRFFNPHSYVVGMEPSIYDLKVNLIKNIRRDLRTPK